MEANGTRLQQQGRTSTTGHLFRLFLRRHMWTSCCPGRLDPNPPEERLPRPRQPSRRVSTRKCVTRFPEDILGAPGRTSLGWEAVSMSDRRIKTVLFVMVVLSL